MTDPNLLGGTPAFRIGGVNITGRVLADGTPAIPGTQLVALLDILGRPERIAMLDLSELQRLEDWVKSTSANQPSSKDRS